ncbi:alkaline phosphatase [bacterium]|nr:alkaline phosphatase [bacterium]
MATLKQLTTQYTAIGLYVFVIAVILPAIYFITTADQQPVARNVVLVIGEGLSFPLLHEARAAHGEPLFLDQMPGLGVTYSSKSHGWPPDRAAVATALATGRWGFPGHLNAWGEAENLIVSYPSLLDVAQERGRRAGFITTDEIITPMLAAFGTHVISATDWNRILQEWVLRAQPQALLGGGRRYFNPSGHPEGSYRTPEALRALGVRDDEMAAQADYFAYARAAGYTVVRNASDLSPIITRNVIGLFSPDALPFYIEPELPSISLPLMVRFVVQHLSKEGDGYFLVVHQGAIRRAALLHTQDLTGDGLVNDEDGRIALRHAVNEVLALDTTVRLLQKIASGQDTLLVVVGAVDWCGLSLTAENGATVARWTAPGTTPMDMPLWAEGPGASELTGHHPLAHVYSVIERQLVRSQ